MTKFLADENISPAVVKFLRHKGLDVKEVRELGIRSPSDAVIMEFARQEERVLLTLDKHFGNILLYPLSTHHGVVRIRLHPPLLSEILRVLEDFFQRFDITMMRGTLIVLERDGFRVRRAH